MVVGLDIVVVGLDIVVVRWGGGVSRGVLRYWGVSCSGVGLFIST